VTVSSYTPSCQGDSQAEQIRIFLRNIDVAVLELDETKELILVRLSFLFVEFFVCVVAWQGRGILS
jgi:hypothetical protein